MNADGQNLVLSSPKLISFPVNESQIFFYIFLSSPRPRGPWEPRPRFRNRDRGSDQTVKCILSQKKN